MLMFTNEPSSISNIDIRRYLYNHVPSNGFKSAGRWYMEQAIIIPASFEVGF